MQIQCECGKFQSELTALPKNTPGRLVCYCDDCQSYLHHLKRADLLDKNGGTEIVPVYPVDFKILSGKEHLKCTRLAPNGMFRFSTTCCNTPIANTRPKMPWVGILHRAFTAKNANQLEQTLGPVRARALGRFAKGTPPPGTPKGYNFKGFSIVMPFVFKGKIFKKSEPSPFFADDGVTAIVTAKVLSKDERQAALASAGF